MRGRKRQVEYERGSSNVYADLGSRGPEDMLVKAKLVSKIAELIAERGLTQSTAAVVLGVPQPKLSKMLRGQFRGLSERKLMDCLTRLGQDVNIVVRTTSRAEGRGEVSVTLRPPRSGSGLSRERGIRIFRSGRKLSTEDTDRALDGLRQERERRLRGTST